MPFYSKDDLSSCDYAVLGNTLLITEEQLKQIIQENKLESNIILLIEISSYSHDDRGLTGEFSVTIQTDNHDN